jgi:hypothetical protein
LTDKLLAIGWDVGGWYGSKQGIAMLSADPEGTIEFVDDPVTKRISKEVIPSGNPVKFFSDLIGISNCVANNRKIILAVDAPLAVPENYRKLISVTEDFLNDEGNLFREKDHIDSKIFFRDCERWVKERFQKPMPCVGSWLGNNATLAQAYTVYWTNKNSNWSLLPQQKEQSNAKNKIIEVYPATIKEEKRNSKIKEFFAKKVENGKKFQKLEEGTDEYDAAICALHALAFGMENEWCKENNLPALVGYEEKRSSADKEWEFPEKEGWIYHFDEFEAS